VSSKTIMYDYSSSTCLCYEIFRKRKVSAVIIKPFSWRLVFFWQSAKVKFGRTLPSVSLNTTFY